ncbi:ImmA/IrrE family metallo-endopeptidase [Shumkonia mesophila]|uniref:ImmA/IrrE family metallo-endopeptidase n=1 Tax=Shumkonia mesophila TaxID=2838854 RepID=UPI002934B11C|nr:ImmA/IrrE family metallo-endopeptidase [Shumkonia mesophila]
MTLSEQLSVINRFRKQAPVDVEALAKALGIGVRYAFLDAEVSGMIERSKDGRCVITVNAADPPTRQRFTLAHEISHYMLHRHLIGDGLDDDRAYRSTAVGKYHNTNIGPKHETEANKLAASILMPHELIDDLKRKGHQNPAQLARALNVSEHAMSIRISVPYDG